MEELLRELDVHEEAFVWVCCRRVEFGDKSLTIDLDLTIDDGDHRYSSWRVSCSGVLFHAGEFSGEEIDLRESDPLLSPYHDRRACLSFRGAPGDVDATIGALWLAHHRMFGEVYSFGRFLNGYSLDELLAGGFGQLACGPMVLVSEYERILRSRGVETHLSEFDTNPYENRDAKLLVVGRGLVIAESFSAVRA